MNRMEQAAVKRHVEPQEALGHLESLSGKRLLPGLLQTELTHLLGCTQRQISRSREALGRWGDIVRENEGNSKRWRLKCSTKP